MTISASNLYIVVTYSSYDGISGNTDNLFTDRKEAEVAATEFNNYFAKSKQNNTLKSSVMTLDDYISEVRSEARDEGRRDERDSYSN